MEPRFLRWVLLLLLITVVTAEAARGSTTKAPKDEEKSTTVRTRSSSRFSPRVTAAKTTSESPLIADSTTSKTSRRASGFRKTTNRFNKSQTATSAPTTVAPAEKNPAKYQTETAITQSPDKVKPTPRKVVYHQPSRTASRNRLFPKLKPVENEKTSNNNTAKEHEELHEEKKYLPDELSDEARAAQEEEDVEGVEAPKVPDVPRIGGRLIGKLNDEKVKPESEVGLNENQRARTGRKIQVPIRPGRPLKSTYPPLSKVSQKEKPMEDSEVESTVAVMQTERTTEHDVLDFRKKLSESHLKQDSVPDGSESVRVNIPLTGEEAKKTGSTVPENSSSLPIEVPKRLMPYKTRGRLTTTTKKPEKPEKPEKLESESTTLASELPSTRAPLRRGGIVRGTPTEAINRVRNRHPERKTTHVAESTTSTTTSAPSTRRRTYIPKSPHRLTPHELPKSSEHNNVSEKKTFHVDNRKPTRTRSRYRTETTTTSTTQNVLSSTTTSTTTTSTTTSTSTTTTTLAPPTTAAPSSTTTATTEESSVSVTPVTIGRITPLYEADLPVTTFQPAIRWSSTSPAPNVDSEDDPGEVVEIERRSGEVDAQLEDNIGEKRRGSKEDFFNKGLGFRGRKPGVEEAPTAITSSTTAPASQTENIPQGNPGWTLKRRPGHWQDGPQPFSSSDVSSIPAEQVKGLTSTSSNSVKSGRRGNKTYTKAPGGVAKDEEDESDNYPPEFKARLAQMQKAGTAPQPRAPSEEPRLHTSSNIIDTTSADLELASSDNAYQVVVETTFPNYPTLSLSNASPLDEQQVRNIKKED